MKTFLALVFAIAMVTPAAAQQSTFRDDRGRTIGTATINGNTTTFRDDRGRTTGTATTDSQGTTTFRNDRGQTTGTGSSFDRAFNFNRK
jgi:hypothetical protein